MRTLESKVENAQKNQPENPDAQTENMKTYFSETATCANSFAKNSFYTDEKGLPKFPNIIEMDGGGS